MSRIEEMNRVIGDLCSRTPDVDGAALVDDNGLLIASALKQETDELAVSATTATLTTLGERVTEELHRGTFKRITLKGSKGYGMIVRCGEACLCVTANRSAKLGVIFLDVQRAANELTTLLR